MGSVNVYEAKTHLSRLLRRVRGGEEIVIAAAGRPVARIVPLAPDTGPRVLGGDEGVVWDAEDFNAPLPDAIVDAFYGSRPMATSRSQGRRPRAGRAAPRRAPRA
ncbi:MAG: type II toxin-antitoxin system Phd/YefM family antitoxin [Deltaproteobacteria bacterium]|nr:type II toxin-antitoxin system Phd/YefM family antitoxin [Deltaproteobacteria bacterium]